MSRRGKTQLTSMRLRIKAKVDLLQEHIIEKFQWAKSYVLFKALQAWTLEELCVCQDTTTRETRARFLKISSSFSE
jgi:hypothetical protein